MGTRGVGEKGRYHLFDELAGCEATTTRDMSHMIHHQQDLSHRTELGPTPTPTRCVSPDAIVNTMHQYIKKGR